MFLDRQSTKSLFNRAVIFLVMITFISSSVFSCPVSHAQEILPVQLAASQAAVVPGASISPVLVKGIQIYPNNPLKFDFIVEKGDFDNTKLSALDKNVLAKMSSAERSDYLKNEFRKESERLIKYFLTALTVPEKDMWVNLSPLEKDRIVPESLGNTDMGIELLEQDHTLKKLSSSLINPENELGEEFWNRVYSKIREKYGDVDIPSDMFYKVWIVPEEATILEYSKGAFISDCKLKVMLEQDYLSMSHNKGKAIAEDKGSEKKYSALNVEVFKKIILPEIKREVNSGKRFEKLRQIYYATILAAWYKKALKDSLVNKVYSDKERIGGIEAEGDTTAGDVYAQYLETVRKGTVNVIREEYDPVAQQIIPKKYFSGGYTSNGEGEMVASGTKMVNDKNISFAMGAMEEPELVTFDLNAKGYSFDTNVPTFDLALLSKEMPAQNETTAVSRVPSAASNSDGQTNDTRIKLPVVDSAMINGRIKSIVNKQKIKHNETQILKAKSFYSDTDGFLVYYYFNGDVTTIEQIDPEENSMRIVGTRQGNVIKKLLQEDIEMGMKVALLKASIKTSRGNEYDIERSMVNFTEVNSLKTRSVEKVVYKKQNGDNAGEMGYIEKDTFNKLVPLWTLSKKNGKNKKTVMANEPEEEIGPIQSIYREEIQPDKTELLTVVFNDTLINFQTTVAYDYSNDVTKVVIIDGKQAGKNKEKAIKSTTTYKGNRIYESIYERIDQISSERTFIYPINIRLHTENYSIFMHYNANKKRVEFVGEPLDPGKMPPIKGTIHKDITEFFDFNELLTSNMGKMALIDDILGLVKAEGLTDEQVTEGLAKIELLNFSVDKELIDLFNRPFVIDFFFELLEPKDMETLDGLKRRALAMEVLSILMEKGVFDANEFRSYKRDIKLQNILYKWLEELDGLGSKLSFETIDDVLNLILDFTDIAYQQKYQTEKQLMDITKKLRIVDDRLKEKKKAVSAAEKNNGIDSAQITMPGASVIKSKDLGGIDLDANNIKMNIKTENNGQLVYKKITVPSNIKIDGFIPNILSITPINNVTAN